MKTIDINCDLGEGGPHDADLMPLITSCNIACGGHYGDDASILKTIRLAKAAKVKIGAHPSYPDKANFGRKPMQLSKAVLSEEFKEQVLRIKNSADAEGYPITHIKPHGALYNDTSTNPEIAKTIGHAILELNLDIPLFVAYNSEISKIYEGKINMIVEGFGDRNYNKDYSLVSRKFQEALIEDKQQIAQHVLNMVLKNRVEVFTGENIPIKLDTICMHGDAKNVLENITYLRTILAENSVKVTAYGHH